MPKDVKPDVKGGKKLPKWAIPVGAVSVVLLVLYMKSRKASGETSSASSETADLNRQSFIPVTGENVAGVGASGGGSSSGGSGEGVNEFLKEWMLQQREEAKEQRQFERERNSSITGGGAPTTTAPPGTVAAPPAYGGTPAGPPPATPAPPPTAKCPSSFPHLNGSKPSPHTCFQEIKCGNGCQGHRYQDGHSECQTKSGGKCHW